MSPNVLVILSDQLRRQALGCYGDPNVATPNIDALAWEGVRFTQACSTYPICVPFRFTLMTGHYGHSRFVPGIEWRMSPAETTLADVFNDAGYHTIYCGKWHLYGGHAHLPKHTARKTNLTWIPPEHQGRWQRWLGFDVANNPFDTYYFEDADPRPRRLPRYQTDGLFDLVMDDLAGRPRDAAPFMCVLSVEPPHFPLDAPQADLARWEGRDLTLPPNFMVRDERPTPARLADAAQMEKLLDNLRTYYAMIENLDQNVGRMLSFLEAEGLSENTIVVLVSDHGQMDGAHAERSTIKAHPYEESIGIPLIVRDPRYRHRRGLVVSSPVATEDLFPTLAGLAGVAPPVGLPGADSSPLVRGEIARLPRDGVLLEFVHDLRPAFPYHGVYWRGFRSDRFKYTVLGDAETGGMPWQFYDLQDDPYEMHNRVDDPASRGLVVQHHRWMRERMVETNDHYVLASAFGVAGLNLWTS